MTTSENNPPGFSGGTPGTHIETTQGAVPARISDEVPQEAKVASQEIKYPSSQSGTSPRQVAAEDVAVSTPAALDDDDHLITEVADVTAVEPDYESRAVVLPRRGRIAMVAVMAMSVVIVIIGFLVIANAFEGASPTVGALLVAIGAAGLLLGLLPRAAAAAQGLGRV